MISFLVPWMTTSKSKGRGEWQGLGSAAGLGIMVNIMAIGISLVVNADLEFRSTLFTDKTSSLGARSG